MSAAAADPRRRTRGLHRPMLGVSGLVTAIALSIVFVGLPSCGDGAPAARSAGSRVVRLPPPDPLPAGGRFARAEHGVGQAERLLGSGELTAASQALDEALVLDPMNRQALIVRGRIRLREGRATDALASFEAARQMQSDVVATEWIGLTYLALRDEALTRQKSGTGDGPSPVEYAELARAAFEQVLRLDPSNGNARHNMGYCSRLAGRIDESVQILSALIAEQPERVRSLYELGVSLQTAGRLDEARAVYERLLGIQPDHGSAQRALEGLGG